MNTFIDVIAVIFIIFFIIEWIEIPFKINEQNKLLKEILELLKNKR